MYAVVTWEVDPAAPDPAAVQADALTALGGRKYCDLRGELRIVRVESETDFLDLRDALEDVARRPGGGLRYAAWALRAGSPMRTNVPFDRACAREVIDG